jgi:hypothetical protein
LFSDPYPSDSAHVNSNVYGLRFNVLAPELRRVEDIGAINLPRTPEDITEGAGRRNLRNPAAFVT